MSLVKSLSAAVVIGAAASAATAAIVPSWRINPISPAAIAAQPQLANAVSVSLLVSLSGASRFNVAGLNINGLMAANTLPGATFYNDAFGAGSNAEPGNSALFPVFPALEFDTYVSSADRTGTLVPGRNDGPGAAQFGQGADAGIFNVAWGGADSGVLNGQGLEIARLTMFGVLTGGGGSTPVRGTVVASDNLQNPVQIPAIPVFVPEPGTIGLAVLGLGLMGLRRR